MVYDHDINGLAVQSITYKDWTSILKLRDIMDLHVYKVKIYQAIYVSIDFPISN